MSRPGKMLAALRDRWSLQSLAVQFLLAGGVVSAAAMALVGVLVTSVIEAGITKNSAAATALYVDSVIAPLLPDMRRSEELSESVTQALNETIGQGALRDRLVAFRLWRPDGTILYASDGRNVGERFEPSAPLRKAIAGEMVAELDGNGDEESAAEDPRGMPLLAIYNPVLQPWSGEVVAVSEFHERAGEFEQTLRQAVLRSWFAVALVTSGFFLILSAIVFRGSRVIDSQSRELNQRIGELSDLLAQNRSLRWRMQRASQRAAALNERFLRRIGADLHDGPAQLVAFAALRLDSPALADPAAPGPAREREIDAIKSSLDDAMREIRSICTGLVLPHIETAELDEMLRAACMAHQQRTGAAVELSMSPGPASLSPSAKICIYRFVQEALNNGYRHAGGAKQKVTQSFTQGRLSVEVSDRGPGFDPASVRSEGLGLAGLRDRVESLGGQFVIETSGHGTRVAMSLNTEELEPA